MIFGYIHIQHFQTWWSWTSNFYFYFFGDSTKVIAVSIAFNCTSYHLDGSGMIYCLSLYLKRTFALSLSLNISISLYIDIYLGKAALFLLKPHSTNLVSFWVFLTSTHGLVQDSDICTIHERMSFYDLADQYASWTKATLVSRSMTTI